MANDVTGRIKYIDQFDADVTLASEGQDFIIQKIRVLSAADGDIFRLENISGVRLFHIVNTGAADTVECDFGPKGYNFGNKGVIIDVSDCTGMTATDGSDAVWIFTL